MEWWYVMNKKYKTWIIRGSRLFSQLFFLILFGNFTLIVGLIVGFSNVSYGGFGIPVPVNQPIAAPYTTAFNIFELLQWEISHAIFPFLTIGLLCVYGLIFGNGYCGWACPFGFVQEVVSWAPVRKRIPSKVQIKKE